MNLAKAHAKARAAVKRREENIEQEELEGGEINLIPYLDIVTNLMLFLLASISTGLIMGQINTTLPDRAPPSAGATDQPETPPDQRPLGLIAWVDDKALRLYAQNADDLNGGDPKKPLFKYDLPVPANLDRRPVDIPEYDWRGLNAKLYEIASARWKGKPRAYPTYRITLVADSRIPYATIISLMDAVRCKIADPGTPPGPCILPRPAQGEDGKPLTDKKTGMTVLIDSSGKEISGSYDPDKMALFHDIVFSPGLQ